MNRLKREFDFQKRRFRKRWEASSGSLTNVGALVLLSLLALYFFLSPKQKPKNLEKVSLSSETHLPSDDLSNSFDPQFNSWAKKAQRLIRQEKNVRYYQNLETQKSELSLKQEQSPLAYESRSIAAPRHVPENSVLYSLHDKQNKQDPDFITRFKQNAASAGYAVEIDPVTLDILEVRDLQTGEILPADQLDF